MIEMYERFSGTDLLWMIRQEDNFLVLILYHEVLEVLPSSFMLRVAELKKGSCM